MATKFNPLKFYAFNNVKVLDSSNPGDIVLYADGVDLRKRFEALLAQVKAGEDPNFDDLIRLITGLGFVIVPGKMGVLSDPIPLFNRSAIFNSDSPAPGKTIITLLPKEREIIGDVIYRLFRSFQPAGKIFQDKNFSIPDVEQFSVDVDVVGTKVNVFDIYKDDQLFTNGELNPTKTETSLTYAYAFETFEVQGTKELVLKEVELASPNNEKFIQEANNESDFDIVDKLRNILYDGENTADIEKEVLLGNPPQDIGVDKLYNVVTVQIPKLSFGYQQSNILDYVLASSFNNLSVVNPPSTIQTFLSAGSLFGSLPFGVYELRDLVTELSFLISIATPEDLNKIAGYQFNLDTIQLAKAQAEFLATNATNKDVNASKIANFKTLETFLKQVSANDVSLLSTVQTQAQPEFVNKFVDNQEIIALDSYYRLFEGLFNKRKVTNPNSIQPKAGLTRFNISELFQTFIKEGVEVAQFGGQIIQNAPEAFSFDQREPNLYRNSRLSGIKIVKSSIPYDPVNPAGFDESVVQTFHVSTQQSGQDKTITLFDSQVVYGKEYYYTAFGVYEVDGKFYSYDNVVINSDVLKVDTGVKTTSENLIEQGPNKGFYFNPCCRTQGVSDNQNLFDRQAGTIPGVSGATDIADAFFNQNVSKDPNKADILDFVNKTISFSALLATFPIPGMTDPASIVKQGKGFLTPPIDTSNPDSYPVLVKFLFDLYLATANPAFLGAPANGNIYQSQFAFGFKGPGVPTDDLDYYTGNDAVSSFLNQKRKEMFCFLCRRAGTTNPSNNPTAARIIEQTLRNSGYLSKDLNKPESKFLGGLVDCRKFGYKNPDGFGGFVAPEQAIVKPAGSAALNNCKITKPVFETTRIFNSIEFDTNEMDSKTIVEVPLDDAKATIVGRVPMPPDVTFVPLADVDNKILIRFQEAVQSDDYEQPIDAMLSFLNGTTVMNKLKEQSGSEEFVLARSQGDLQNVVMFRSDVKPNSLSDLILNESAKNVSIDWKVAEILDPILPNKDYWYVFATRDITGLYSAGSPVFRLKLVNDSGYTYADLEPYEFIVKEEKITTKTFKKLIKIKPSFDETLAINAEQVGTLKLFSTIKKGNAKGATDAPPKFKIRVRSKKTKRVFDINLKYTQEVQQISSKKLLKVIEENAELIDTKITGVKNVAPTAAPFFIPTATAGVSTIDAFEPSTISGQPTPIPVPEDLTPGAEVPTTPEPLPGAPTPTAESKPEPISEIITPATVPETPVPSIDEPVEQSPEAAILPKIDLP
jgi:hypothetical protein